MEVESYPSCHEGADVGLVEGLKEVQVVQRGPFPGNQRQRPPEPSEHHFGAGEEGHPERRHRSFGHGDVGAAHGNPPIPEGKSGRVRPQSQGKVTSSLVTSCIPQLWPIFYSGRPKKPGYRHVGMTYLCPGTKSTPCGVANRHAVWGAVICRTAGGRASPPLIEGNTRAPLVFACLDEERAAAARATGLEVLG